MTLFREISGKTKFLLLSLIIFSTAFILEENLEVLDSKRINISQFQKVLDQKFRATEEALDEISKIITEEGLNQFISLHASKYFNIFNKHGIVLLAFDEGELKFWNSNILPLQTDNQLFDEARKVINPGNGWYVVNRRHSADSIMLAGMILIKHDYIFENEFLTNDFHSDFKLYPEVEINFSHHHDNIVTDPSQRFLFSLIEPKPALRTYTYSLVASLLYVLSFLLLLVFLYRSFNSFRFKSNTSRNLWFLSVVAILITLRYLMLEHGYPGIFRTFSIFQPQHYAKSSLFPSLGDFLINTALILFIAISFAVHFRLFDKNTNPCRSKSMGWTMGLGLVSVLFMVFFHYMFSGLIFNSNIPLEVYNFFYLNHLSFIAYLIIAMLSTSLVIITDRMVFLSSTLVELKVFILIIGGVIISVFLFFSFLGFSFNPYAILFLISLTATITVVRYYKYRYKYSFQVFIVFLVSLFSLAFITNKSREKEKNIRQVMVVNLANERDQVAEFLLAEVEDGIKNDNMVYSILNSVQHTDHELFEYLKSNYFDGYFRKYELQIATCGYDFDLLLEDLNEFVHCYTFFYDMIDEYGVPVSINSGFYFLDNLNARISYLGIIIYELDEYPYEKTLFISLDSKLKDDQLGYPELLLEGKFTTNPVMAQYSYAKYNNGLLINRSGTCPYPLTLQKYPYNDNEFSYFRKDGYEHLVYNFDEDNAIILSRPKITTVDLLTSFSYNFIFFYLLYTLALLVCKYPIDIRSWRIDFKNKIKFSMIGVLILSLIIIGTGTVYYNVRQFENKQNESISERTQSVLVELEYRLGLESELTPEMSYYITGMLIQLSNVFYTDINLYDIQGNLYASSRPEVFELGLIGEQMNPEAYSEMLIKNNSRFIHKESISNLSYLSAYVPFTNANNETLSYLNLPYFTRQSILKEDIYTLVTAVANIYAILILITIIIAIIVSNTITKPLQLIQKKLRELSIGRKNEQIDYKSDDEIGSLIKEYNRMVDELDNSAEMLAKSERESAWREMAKQIAHEIKNPLTPMKLSIQHLQRSWDDKVENWDEVLKKTTRNLIEQIDHLSSIATAFSHFAKLPKATAGEVDIVNTINNVAGLFSSSGNTEIMTKLNGIEELYVKSDKMQLNRVFINLLKNSVQSIPEDRKGVIIIEIEREKDMAHVTVTDNGKGIPPELHNKMFTPNFTTKSGGTGLGLAIVKSVIEQSGGTVGYRSEYRKGSSFFFKLPISNKQSPEN